MTDQITLERELVRRAREGDNEAFEDLVRVYQEPLYRYLCRLSGNGEDAMELTQNSFVKAYVSIRRFRGESSFKTYLFRIATNSWKNTIRDRSKRHHVDIEQVSLASAHNPHEEFEQNQERRKFWSLVERLPARQKQALVLRVQEGYPFEEVAKVMGCSTGSAKASYHHAVEKLKLAVTGEDR